MKKLFLIIALLAMVGNSIAQDVYAVGYYSVGNGTNAALYKNGNRLYIAHHPSYYSRASKVTFNSDGDVYWMVNYYNTNGSLHHSEIQKNNEVLSVPDGFQVVDFYSLGDMLKFYSLRNVGSFGVCDYYIPSVKLPLPIRGKLEPC